MRKVAITGMGIVSPIGNNVQDFWNSLIEGKCGIGPITKFDTAEFKVKVAAEVKDFDPMTYMSKVDVLHSDLYSQFAMAAACQAVEESGICGTLPDEKIGVYIGTGTGGIKTFMTEHKKYLDKGPKRVSPFFIPMMICNMASGLVAIRFHFKGSALPAVTACASGSHAIGEAVRLIRHGYADAMVAGGAEATVNELAASGFSTMGALSFSEDPMQASLPFDKRRTGFVMGEGAGALVLEEYEHAKNRGAKIYGIISGYGTTCDAYHITSPHPEGEGGARAIADAIKEAGLDTDKIYYNAHGTGTPMNDSIETLAVKKAFGEERAKKIHISSTKSMTGHMLGAAGAAEAVICVMAMNEGIIPPTIGLTEADPECDLNYTPLKAVKADVDAAVSTSLGFGGHNASLVFEKEKA